MQQQGYKDIRVNQEQVDAEGVRVGLGRPDLQARTHNQAYDTMLNMIKILSVGRLTGNGFWRTIPLELSQPKP